MSGGYTKVVFERVGFKREKIGKCQCGKRRVRRKEFWNTLNPFNKNAEGKPKTREEILVKLREEAEIWMKEPIYCDKCFPGITGGTHAG